MDMVEEVMGKKTGEKHNRRDFEVQKRRKRAAKHAQDNPILMEMREKFI